MLLCCNFRLSSSKDSFDRVESLQSSMGRELRRVPLDFIWPIKKTWEGFLNPHYTGHCADCKTCNGTGTSPEAAHMRQLWYGYAPFKPEDRGSKLFLPVDTPVRAFAERNVNNALDFYGASKEAVLMSQQPRRKYVLGFNANEDTNVRQVLS